LQGFPGPALYLFETLLAVGLWFLIFKTFRQVHPVEVVTKGDISMARVIPVPDVSGNPVRTERPSNVGLLYSGSYIPVFYNRENPARCIGAWDLDCDLNLPKNSSSA
jgi:hypothetical protein